MVLGGFGSFLAVTLRALPAQQMEALISSLPK